MCVCVRVCVCVCVCVYVCLLSLAADSSDEGQGLAHQDNERGSEWHQGVCMFMYVSTCTSVCVGGSVGVWECGWVQVGAGVGVCGCGWVGECVCVEEVGMCFCATQTNTIHFQLQPQNK